MATVARRKKAKGRGRPRSMRKAVKVSADIEAADFDRIKRIAAKEEKSVSQLIREALRSLLDQRRSQ